MLRYLKIAFIAVLLPLFAACNATTRMSEIGYMPVAASAPTAKHHGRCQAGSIFGSHTCVTIQHLLADKRYEGCKLMVSARAFVYRLSAWAVPKGSSAVLEFGDSVTIDLDGNTNAPGYTQAFIEAVGQKADGTKCGTWRRDYSLSPSYEPRPEWVTVQYLNN